MCKKHSFLVGLFYRVSGDKAVTEPIMTNNFEIDDERRFDMRHLKKVDEYLRYIDNTDRISCLKVFSAIKNEYGDSGFQLAHEFASKAHNYDFNWVKSNWQSADSSMFGIGILHVMAMDGGFTSEVFEPKKKKENSPKVQPYTEKDRIAYARSIWRRSNTNDDCVGSHAYSIAKEINWAAGAGRATLNGSILGRNADCLVVPVYNLMTDLLQSVHCINAEGKKQNFGPVRGGGLIIGNSLRQNSNWAVAEGWASTVACVHWHGFDCAVCSFGNSRFDEVYDLVSNRFSPKKIFMMGENDD